jgi:enediyne biosynthesis protein E5
VLKMKNISIKIQLFIFLSFFAFYLSFMDRDWRFLFGVSLSVVFCFILESLIIYFKEKKFRLADSAAITGLIIGYVLASSQPWWIFLLASLVAVCSKHIIRVKAKHIFNPAAFGIFSAILLTGAYTQWKGTYAWYILVPFGIYFVSKIRKAEILIGYIVAFFILFGSQAIMQKISLVNILGYLNYFFIFIMLVEPKTTPIYPKGKVIFGVACAVLIFIFAQIGVKVDAELSALIILNLLVPLFNKFPERREA